MAAPVILADAWEDLLAMRERLAPLVGQDRALSHVEAILDDVERLGDYPEWGPLHQDSVLQAKGFRKLLSVGNVAVYRVDGGVPTVYRVFSKRQDYFKLVD